MKSMAARFGSRLMGVVAALALSPAVASAADARASGPSAKAEERTSAYDESRMRPPEDRTATGSAYAPVTYDDGRMQPGEAKPHQGDAAKGAEGVEYDDARMKPVEAN